MGKSALALALQQELGWALFSSDTVRKCLAGLNPAQPQADAFGQDSVRQAAVRQAAVLGIRTLFVECVCPREVALQRLAARRKSRLEGTQQGASWASDARLDLYDAQASAWEDFIAAEGQGCKHAVIMTTQLLAVSLGQLLEALDDTC